MSIGLYVCNTHMCIVVCRMMLCRMHCPHLTHSTVPYHYYTRNIRFYRSLALGLRGQELHHFRCCARDAGVYCSCAGVSSHNRRTCRRRIKHRTQTGLNKTRGCTRRRFSTLEIFGRSVGCVHRVRAMLLCATTHVPGKGLSLGPELTHQARSDHGHYMRAQALPN